MIFVVFVIGYFTVNINCFYKLQQKLKLFPNRNNNESNYSQE